MQTFTRNNLSLAYERLGTDEPLVLIHGYPLDHTVWDEVVALSHDFDLILPDMRGFGQSDAPDSPWTMSDLADDLAGLLDHLGVASAFVAGHSMGGYVALAFAAKYPSRVRGLGLVASQAAADSDERKEGRRANARQIAEQGIGETVAGMTPKLSADTRVQKFVHDLMRKQKPAGYIGALHAMAGRTDTLEMVASASFDVLIVHGEADALIPFERAKEVESACARARLFGLPGIGHLPMMESPQATADALRSFL
jgi:pimeloyl-ACP methyl ester carboxylesterase